MFFNKNIVIVIYVIEPFGRRKNWKVQSYLFLRTSRLSLQTFLHLLQMRKVVLFFSYITDYYMFIYGSTSTTGFQFSVLHLHYMTKCNYIVPIKNFLSIIGDSYNMLNLLLIWAGPPRCSWWCCCDWGLGVAQD